jgi:hypothetical protein
MTRVVAGSALTAWPLLQHSPVFDPSSYSRIVSLSLLYE